MTPPTVTIGIPCRNARPWLAAAIKSALAQENITPDVVVVDDGSTDGSLDVIQAFGDRVRTFRHEGQGAPAARNRALAEARGGWIQFLDADDYLLPDKIRLHLDAAAPMPPDTCTRADGGSASPPDLLCGPLREERDPGCLPKSGQESDPPHALRLSCMVPYSPVLSETWRGGKVASLAADAIDTTLDIFSQWILWQMPQTGGALWPVDTLRSLGGWKTDQPCCQEHELYLRALKSGVRFAFCPETRAVYRLWSEDTLCRRDPGRVIRIRSGLIADMLDWLEANGHLRGEHRQHAGRAFFEMARSLAVRDLSDAAQYHAAWKQKGLIRPEGPAAPAMYRAFYRCFGFAFAERIAAWLR